MFVFFCKILVSYKIDLVQATCIIEVLRIQTHQSFNLMSVEPTTNTLTNSCFQHYKDFFLLFFRNKLECLPSANSEYSAPM